MPKSFVFCDRVSHVRHVKTESLQSDIVALTPACAWFCQTQDIPYLRLDDYYSSSELNRLAEVTLRREYSWAKWVDETLSQIVPEFAATGFTPARAQLYFLKRSIDSYVRPARILQEFVAKVMPELLIVFKRYPFYYPNLEVPPPGRPFFAWLAPEIVGKTVKVAVLSDILLNNYWNQTQWKTKKSFSVFTRRFWWERAGKIRARVVRKLELASSALRHVFPSQMRAAWVGDIRELAFSVPILRREGVKVYRPPRFYNWRWKRAHCVEAEHITRTLEKAWGQFADSPDFWKPLDPVSPALRSVAGPFFKKWLTIDVPMAWAEFLGARTWLQEGRFGVMFGTEVQDLSTATQLMAARSLEIPTFLAIHNPPGGAVDLPVQDCLGPIQSDIFLVNGKGDVDYFERLAERLKTFPRGKNIAIGSARLEKMFAFENKRVKSHRRLLKEDGKRFLLYVPTHLFGYARYFNEGNMSDVAYFELQQRILKTCSEFQDVQVLYIPFPSKLVENPIPEFINQRVTNGQVIQGVLCELMWAADGIILDFPSTALAEVVLTNKPLLVYADRDWMPLLPSAKLALQKRAWVSESPEEFEVQVRQFLGAGDFSPVTNPNHEFLRLYGTHMLDGRSAERAAGVILKAAPKKIELKK